MYPPFIMVVRSVRRALGALGVGGVGDVGGVRVGRLLVACSGGVDSTVLLDVLGELARDRGLDLAVGHVHHGLRGEAADADQAFVAALAQERGLPFRAARVAPGRLRQGRSSRARPTLQEAARRLRYDALNGMAADLGCAWIATAHTRDDQAETVLLRLLRGAGPEGLAGIPERSGIAVRPLLGVGRAEILAHARARGLAWREDASNASAAYARNRVRGWLRQLEAELNPGVLRAIADLAEAQRRELEWLGALAEGEASRRLGGVTREGMVIEAERFEELPEALQRRLAREALRRVGAARDVSRVHLERVVRFLREARPGTRLEVPGGLELVRPTRREEGSEPPSGRRFRLRATLSSGPAGIEVNC